MARSAFGEGTNYSYQSKKQIIEDLNNERVETSLYLDKIKEWKTELEQKGYWKQTVPMTFKTIVAKSIMHLETSVNEMQEIATELETQVQEHHIKRLWSIGNVADEINGSIGEIWHGLDAPKFENYDNPDFRIAERIYQEARQCMVNLLDLTNMAGRLKDFEGMNKTKTSGSQVPKNNPWNSGMFYLLVVVVLLLAFSTMAFFLSWAIIPVIIIAALIGVGILGANQMKNDGVITDATYITLMVESYKKLYLIKPKKGSNEGK